MNVQQSLTDWIPTVQGRYINMDGAYGAQCWDLAAHWCTTLGLPVINTGGPGRWPGWAGNMVDAFPQTDAIAAAWELVSPDDLGQTGDIAVWGDSYWYYPSTHVAVLVADKIGNLLCMSQNSTPSVDGNPYPGQSTGPATLQYLPRQGLIGFIRPRTGLGYQGTVTPVQEDDMATVPQEEWNAVRDAAYRINGVITDPNAKVLTTNDLGAIADAILTRGVQMVDPSATSRNIAGMTNLQRKISWMAYNDRESLNYLYILGAKLDALAGVIAQEGGVSKEEILAQLDASVKASFEDYVPTLVKKEED